MNRAQDPRIDPWAIDEAVFRRLSSLRDKAAFLLRYAVLAPSSHNTQPWRFHVELHGVAVLRDGTRRLPVADPEGREATISVGAALCNYRVAAAHHRMRCDVRYLPHPSLPDLLARVRISPGGDADAELAALFPAIPRRRTYRGLYRSEPLDAPTLERLHGLAAGARAAIRFVHDWRLQAEVGDLVAQADRLQFADPAFRSELAGWLRPRRTRAGDGIPVDALGIPAPAAHLAPWIVSHVDRGAKLGRVDARLAREAPALAVVCSEDSPLGWVEAGELLERFLLASTSLGLQYGFLNQPVQVHDLRCKLRELLQLPLWPQVVVRLGRGAPVRQPTPRRPVEATLVR